MTLLLAFVGGIVFPLIAYHLVTTIWFYYEWCKEKTKGHCYMDDEHDFEDESGILKMKSSELNKD